MKRKTRSEAGELWPQAYAPVTLAECAVHARKLADVQAWLRSDSRLLLVTGPPGCAKSTSVRLACRDQGLQVIHRLI